MRASLSLLRFWYFSPQIRFFGYAYKGVVGSIPVRSYYVVIIIFVATQIWISASNSICIHPLYMPTTKIYLWTIISESCPTSYLVANLHKEIIGLFLKYEPFLRRMAVLLAQKQKCLKNTTTKQKNAHHVQMLPEFGHKIPILSIICVCFLAVRSRAARIRLRLSAEKHCL